jgi:hypothetical protein
VGWQPWQTEELADSSTNVNCIGHHQPSIGYLLISANNFRQMIFLQLNSNVSIAYRCHRVTDAKVGIGFIVSFIGLVLTVYNFFIYQGAQA